MAALVLLVALVGYPGAIVVMHVPPIHTIAMDSPGIAATLVTRAGISGVALWTVVLSPVLPYRRGVRVAALVWALEIPCLIGLAFVLAASPLYPYGMTLGPLSALADQRLGGALMLAVDVAVAVPAVARLRNLPDTTGPAGARAPALVDRSRKALA